MVSVVNESSFKPGSKKREIKTHIFWANNASAKVRKAAASQNVKELKAHFGMYPFDMPAPPSVTNKFNIITGGDDDDEFTLDEISEALDKYESERYAETRMQRRIGTMVYTSAKDVKYTRGVNVYTENWVFPEDNLMAFKRRYKSPPAFPPIASIFGMRRMVMLFVRVMNFMLVNTKQM